MFYQQSNGSTSLPRDFRFRPNEDRPTTPEPLAIDELQPPSAPRPTRLKVRRRNASSFHAPTEQFLASVAAADVMIPTIQEPQAAIPTSEDFEMADREALTVDTSCFLSPQPRDFRGASPPKTPILTLSMKEGCQRPDWSMDSMTSPDNLERPASAMSNNSDFSDDSLYSGSRVSHRSEDGSCTSPDSDFADPFQFPSFSKGKGKALYREEPAQEVAPLNKQLRSKARTDAPWTKEQSAHLWDTYLLYLQDPTVTPFRIGPSAIPPQGIVHRVARQAKRSWKGPRAVTAAQRSSRLSPAPREAPSESESITPTAETPKVYAQWPHSSNATRAHLRELCKSTDSDLVRHHRHLQSRSPTPFSKQFRSHVRTPEPPYFSSFTTQDIALSLTTSTAESMQPDGPLAKLATSDDPFDIPAASSFPPREAFRPHSFGRSRGLSFILNNDCQDRKLGSPFAHTYGPSSSNTLSVLECPSSRTQSDTIPPRPFLRSPVHFDESRSLNSTQKRRAQHPLEEELSPNGAVIRPSILDEQLFGGPLLSNQRRVRSRGFSLGDEAFRRRPDEPLNRVPGLFSKSQTAPNLFTPSEIIESRSAAGPSTGASQLLPSGNVGPPRLGSPFSESIPSQTFPRCLFPDANATIRRGSYATMHQTRRSIESFDFGEGPSLQSRLSHLDQKLKEIRSREAAARRETSQ